MNVQRYLSDHDKQSKLLKQKVELSQGTIEEYKKSLNHSKALGRSQEQQIATQNELIKGLQSVAEQTRAEGKDEGLAEGKALRRRDMEEETKKQLQEQFDKGYYQAEEDEADQILVLQTEIKEAQHNKSFTLGVEPDDERRSLMEVPPLVLDEAEAKEPAIDEPAANPTKQENVATPAEDPVLSPSATSTREA